ncbi:GntR family transcriptional regulator [Rhodococcus erythropolis]
MDTAQFEESSQVAVTKADAAYSTLRKAIVSGEIRSGIPLDEARISDQYEIGRTPLREALKRLALEQFLIWHPRLPPVVRETSLKDLYRLQESRLILEESVIRLSARRITESQVQQLSRTADALRDALLSGAIYEAVELDYQLHNEIAQGADNAYLEDAVAQLNSGSLRLWHQNYSTIAATEDVADRHRTLVNALASRDVDAAAEAIRSHIDESLQNQLKLDYRTDHVGLDTRVT